MSSRSKSTSSSLLELVFIVAVALGLALAIQAFIVKPYRMSQVHAALQLALERRQRENSSGFLATV